MRSDEFMFIPCDDQICITGCKPIDNCREIFINNTNPTRHYFANYLAFNNLSYRRPKKHNNTIRSKITRYQHNRKEIHRMGNCWVFQRKKINQQL